jgi:hypothetical protein
MSRKNRRGGVIKMTDYLASTSNQVTVSVTEAAIATTLTAAVDLASVVTDMDFVLSGVLTSNADNTGIAGQTIQLQQQQTDGTFADVAGEVATTDANGDYSMSLSESVVGDYVFQTVYAGGTV